MASRDGALARALTHFDSDGFRDHLAELVAIPSTSQDPDTKPTCSGIWPTPSSRGWSGWASPSKSTPTRSRGFGPILSAERLEGPDRPTILIYGHGDTVRGLDDQWRAGLSPWTLTEEGDRWYGRGTADNKGQHALNLVRARSGPCRTRRLSGLQHETGAGNQRGTRIDWPARNLSPNRPTGWPPTC